MRKLVSLRMSSDFIKIYFTICKFEFFSHKSVLKMEWNIKRNEMRFSLENIRENSKYVNDFASNRFVAIVKHDPEH